MGCRWNTASNNCCNENVKMWLCPCPADLWPGSPKRQTRANCGFEIAERRCISRDTPPTVKISIRPRQHFTVCRRERGVPGNKSTPLPERRSQPNPFPSPTLFFCFFLCQIRGGAGRPLTSPPRNIWRGIGLAFSRQ